MALPQEQFSSTKDTELVSQGSRTAEVKHDSKSHAIAEGCQNVSQGNGNTHIYIGNLTINPTIPHSGSESGIYLDDSDTSSQTPGATSDPPATFGLAEREEDTCNRSKVDIRQFLSEILPELQRRPGLHRNENCTCKVTPEHGCCGTKVRLRITCALLLNKDGYIIKFRWKRNKHWQELIKEGRVIPEDNVFLCDVAIPPGEAGHCHFCLQLNPSGSSDKTHNWVDFTFTREEYLLKAGKPFNTRTDRYDDDDDNDDRKGPGPGPNRSRKDHPNDMYGKQSQSNGKSSCSTDKESKSGASDSSVDEQETHHYRSEDMQQYLFSEYLAYRLLKIDDAAKVAESEVDQLESARCRVSSLYGLPKCPPVLRSHFAAYLEPLTVEDFREHSHWLQGYSSRNDGLVTETASTSSDSDWSDEFEEAIRIEKETDGSNDDDGEESKSHQKQEQMISREYQNAVPKNAHQENKFEPAQTSGQEDVFYPPVLHGQKLDYMQWLSKSKRAAESASAVGRKFGDISEAHPLLPIATEHSKFDGCWTPVRVTGVKPSPRAGHTLTAVDVKRATMFGGYDGDYYLNDLWLYDGEMKTWCHIAPSSALWLQPRHHHSVCTLVCDDQETKVLLLGGYGERGIIPNDCWILDVMRGSSQKVKFEGETFFRRHAHSVVSVPLLDEIAAISVFGGCTTSSYASVVSNPRFYQWAPSRPSVLRSGVPTGAVLRVDASVVPTEAVVIRGDGSGVPTGPVGDNRLFDITIRKLREANYRLTAAIEKLQAQFEQKKAQLTGERAKICRLEEEKQQIEMARSGAEGT